MSYLSSLLVVIVGVSMGFMVSSINDILQWLTAALFGGYAAANFLKWIWWRFNGYGYFYGMATGLIISLLLPYLFPNLSVILAFPFVILPVSTLGSVLGCLLTPADNMEVLKKFYSNVKPWGYWSPVIKLIQEEDPEFIPNRSFKRDMLNTLIGVIWQMSLIVMPIYLVIRDYKNMTIAIAVIIATSVLLKFNWYDKLEEN